ncbi:acyl-coa n-acyltransferase [Lucifera butyrica]|uniref:Acyl-coa n-acyltransferase n=1 Tax=Lucifera butyrica TaxID=1351585 RepID=A0A498R9B5_9FIRM|nr:GNAT family N-acetyltransferase [Lucifera butyrica]VBB06733.1 acyl-coa n-acyltransferase [Lucifera butyrica]
MPGIRRARKADCKTLTAIAVRSEAYWGYDSGYMEKFTSVYKVTEDFIGHNPAFVIEENEEIIGFYGVLIGPGEISLEYLYIEPESIGKGYGKLLWNHMVNTCNKLGIKELTILSGPQVKDFYVKMGALPAGEVRSLVVKDRKIPRFLFSPEK